MSILAKDGSLQDEKSFYSLAIPSGYTFVQLMEVP